MNVISQLPPWAQGPTRKFVEQSKIEGTHRSPLDADSFQQSFQQGAGAVEMAASDELPGEDQALGEPGLVRRNGATVYFEGDSSSVKGDIEVAVLGRRSGVEYVTYAHSRGNSLITLRMVNEDGSVELRGSQAQRKGGSIEGYLLTGQISAKF
ncbi:hypothetical protein IV102_38050 [bacterium]|nr:hypothetical protein [bacterium]